MPGPNCAFSECIVSRTAKYQGIGIFQIPMRDNDFHVSWRNNIAKVLRRYRVMDKAVRERILTGNIYICERHFKTGDMEFTST